MSENSSDAPASVEKADVQRSLELRVWAVVETISGGYDRTDLLSPEGLEAYARGCRHTLDALAERLEVRLDCKQIEAAVGEQLRRAGKSAGSPSRALNHLLDAIRDKRIAVLDRYEAVYILGPEYRKWEAKLRALDRRGVADVCWPAFQTAKLELSCLHGLYLHLLSDRAWYSKHFERPQPIQEAA